MKSDAEARSDFASFKNGPHSVFDVRSNCLVLAMLIAIGCSQTLAQAAGAKSQSWLFLAPTYEQVWSPLPRGASTKVELHNKTSESLHIFWLDGSGKRKKVLELASGEIHDQDTFLGDVWVMTGSDDKVRAVFSVGEGPAVVEISANENKFLPPSAGFVSIPIPKIQPWQFLSPTYEQAWQRLPGGQPTKFELINRSSEKLRVFWLNGDGKRQFFFEVAAGQKHVQETMVRYVWIVTDTEDRVQSVFWAGDGPSVVEVSRTGNRFLPPRDDSLSAASAVRSVIGKVDGQAGSRNFHVSLPTRIDFEKMVVVVAPRSDRPHVSPDFKSDIIEVLKAAPARVVAYLYSRGCRVYLSPTLIDVEPDLSLFHPRGWEHGTTFRNVEAIFDLKTNGLIVCQYRYSAEDGNTLEENPDTIHSFRHELGHAVDNYLGHMSALPEFRRLYEQDKTDISENSRRRLQYFLQDGDAGPEEAFAELFCKLAGGSDLTGSSKLPDEVAIAFPRLMTYIEKCLNEIGL